METLSEISHIQCGRCAGFSQQKQTLISSRMICELNTLVSDKDEL